jgi:ABC-type Fe3+ transport system substrate-binding protein
MGMIRKSFRQYAAACLWLALAAGCGRHDGTATAPGPAGDALDLYILSPHGSDIRREFADAFSAWHARHFGRAVRVLWPDVGGGGTGSVATYLDRVYKAGRSPDVDLAFGGGSETFGQYAALGFLAPPPPMDAADRRLWPHDPLDAVPAAIFHTPLHGPAADGGHLWVAATMSSFGIEINKDRIAELGLPTPRTWNDIAGPAWIGQLSLSDPTKSGSVKSSYEMIFQQYGWEKGWGVVTRLFANAAVVRDAGANPAEDVGAAEAIAGIVIDFFGRIHITRAGPDIVGFVIPDGGSALDPDPVAMLKGAPHPELAGRFIRFVVSDEGQRLWTFKPGAAGGPRKSALGRLSVLPSLYEREGASMLDPANPFQGAPPLTVDVKARAARGKFMADAIKASLIDNQGLLADVRQAIRAAGDPPALLAKLDAVPPFRRSHVEGGRLVFGDEQPLGERDQAAAADEFSPADPAKAVFTDQLQSDLRNLWRRRSRERLEALLREATTPPPAGR